MNIEQYSKWIGDETHPDKPQYIRGVCVFTCPECSKQISSTGYLNFGYFQIAAATHLRECNTDPNTQARRDMLEHYNALTNNDAEELPF